MSADIRKVRDMNGLIAYFAEILNWRIDLDDFEDIEDIAYDFEAEDIGLKEEAFAKIKSLRQLPPLVDGQKWGIFCVEFDSRKFEVTALRKILSGLIPKRRNSVDHAVWSQQDLLFICFWGSDNDRTIGIAHFEDMESGLPQIKMISCAPAMEDFTQIKTFEDRLKSLKWPMNYVDHEKWQADWSSAFTTGYKQTIRDASTLTVQLAIEAQGIRNRILDILEVESPNGYVHLLYDKFKNTLIHDMTETQFADMYAQTVVYGLFSARCMDETQENFSAAEAVDCIPNTNPFLKNLMRECLGSENSSKLSFDELEIGNVVDLLMHTKTDAIIADFNRQTGGGREDPVIHFYEEFLTAYDKMQKVQRGVYYTPQPVVNFIVRAVDTIIKRDFGIEDGLASTATKTIKVMRQSKRRVGYYYTQVEDTEEVPAVQVLDPATGTGTFIRQTILQIYENFKQKNKGLTASELKQAWNAYVPEHLLPRINAFELMMAPYAVAHMKLAMVLRDTGYDFNSDSRLQVYLANSVEEPGNSDGQLTLWSDPLATESIAANAVKKNTGINIVIGNPPYSVSSSNRGEWILQLLSSYKEGLNEKKLNLDDDYIKFIRYGEYVVSNAGQGILAYISNNSFLDGVTHRRMRKELLETFDTIYILDLHGSSKRHEVSPDGSKDENVFDIQQGVSINIFVKTSRKVSDAKVFHADLFGLRAEKYSVLLQSDMSTIAWKQLYPSEPYYFFAPKDFSAKLEYEKGFLLTDLFVLNNSGIKTDRDSLFIDMDKDRQIQKSKILLSGSIPETFIDEYRVEDSSSYKLTEKIKGKVYHEAYIQSIIYRPYDYQWIYYDPAIISRPGYQTMQHMLQENWGLYVKRGFEDSDAPPVFCCNQLVCMRAWSRPGSIGSEYLFPLYQYKEEFGQLVCRPNFRMEAVEGIEESLGAKMTTSEENNGSTFTALQLMDYIYAVLHSTEYITKYREFLKIEFPRVPFPRDLPKMKKLAALGKKLRLVHCMVNPKEADFVNISGDLPVAIEKIAWKDSVVSLSKSFQITGITRYLWDYYVGGYQPLQKWLKDRKGLTLSDRDIIHYKQMVNAILETDSIIEEINRVGYEC
jgi:hypothetical protein